ncbi:muscle-related coiled-coil [Pelobates cultripes]|uniref:Muscle-restricted coiled-coil protein n=1 Tax=Pelobates cultripes TaxID=61616 RepID=A0AAD1W590_PELCU|nr:muscle-related coiled-coil [Pelobates cultripes]
MPDCELESKAVTRGTQAPVDYIQPGEMDQYETTSEKDKINRLSVVSEDEEDHESALTIVTVLDKVANMVETVQASQKRIEERHREMENTIKTIQIDLLKLAQAHDNTSYTVTKLLEKTRKVSSNVKDVRSRVDKQSDQVNKVESKQEEMLRKNKFRVVIFQEDIECPTRLTVAKDTALDGHLREKLYPDDLSSDEEYSVQESRTTRLKKSGMQRIDNIKKAFSKESMQKTRQNFGKKVSKIRTRIVTPERRERIRQSGERLKQSGERFKQSIAKAAPKKDTFKIKKKEKQRTTAEGQEGSKDEDVDSASENITVEPISEVTYTEVVTVKKKKKKNGEKADLLPQDEERPNSSLDTPLLKLETKLDTDETPLVDIKLSS